MTIGLSGSHYPGTTVNGVDVSTEDYVGGVIVSIAFGFLKPGDVLQPFGNTKVWGLL